jgi:hemoglobin
VCHRDYTSNASVQVMLFKDRLEVWNPGGLPPTLTMENLKGPHPSVPANPLIAEPMYLAKYIERMGTGIRDMVTRCREAGLAEPEFRAEGGLWITTIRRKGATSEATPHETPHEAPPVTPPVTPPVAVLKHGRMQCSIMSEQEQQTSAFDYFGGQPVVDQLVDCFYDRMETLPEAKGIRAMHAADLAPIRIVLKKYLGEWLGGPKHYSAERGHPMLRARHLPFPVGDAERDAWLLCMNGAIDEVLPPTPVREEIRAAIARLADWMRNR